MSNSPLNKSHTSSEWENPPLPHPVESYSYPVLGWKNKYLPPKTYSISPFTCGKLKNEIKEEDETK